ncbi:MAG: hypothetical protein IKM36_03560 [Oscillospiraceae bacterium]|nr:hypothetical protein [Oscillospiraceae bacterium]MBR3849553.1 hypothetical protein [Oscillospiraceae bacterium]
MNKDNVLKILYALLGSFRVFESLIEEFTQCIAAGGAEKSVIKKLTLRLKQLSLLGKSAITLEEFERINETIYSMHVQGKGFNIRILYSFLPNGEPVLLLAFHERAGHRSTDYTPYLKPAAERFRVMKEEYENE